MMKRDPIIVCRVTWEVERGRWKGEKYRIIFSRAEIMTVYVGRRYYGDTT